MLELEPVAEESQAPAESPPAATVKSPRPRGPSVLYIGESMLVFALLEIYFWASAPVDIALSCLVGAAVGIAAHRIRAKTVRYGVLGALGYVALTFVTGRGPLLSLVFGVPYASFCALFGTFHCIRRRRRKQT